MRDPHLLSDNEMFSRFLDDERDVAFDAEFHRRLNDVKFADSFMLFSLEHVALRNVFRVQAIQSRVEGDASLLAKQRTRPPTWGFGRTLGTHLLVAAIAATVALALVSKPSADQGDADDSVARRTTSPLGSALDSRLEIEPVLTGSREAIATLSGVVDCVWSEGTSAKPYASRLTTDEILCLSEGLAQVTFDSGAKVVVEGPCAFRVVDAMSSELEYGKLSAVAPESASGFEVLTPSSRVIDIGTEFGVAVDTVGSSTIHVFKGEVVASGLLPGNGDPEEISLKTNEGVAYSLSHVAGTRIPADATNFAIGVEARLHADQRPETPVTDGLAMWLRADTGVVLDPDNRVRAWQDILVDDNMSADDAMQPADYARPAIRAKGLNGRPSVRFDGRSTFLMTPPMASTASQTIVVVASIGERSTGSGQLLSYQGPPKRILSRPIDNGFIEVNAYGNKIPVFRPVLYAGFDGPKPVNHGGVKNSDSLAYNRPYVFAYRYNHAANRAELFINGRLNGVAEAAVSAAVTSRRVIGKHGINGDFYAGDLAELLIWDRAIEDDELQSIGQHLASMYLGT